MTLYYIDAFTAGSELLQAFMEASTPDEAMQSFVKQAREQGAELDGCEVNIYAPDGSLQFIPDMTPEVTFTVGV